MSGADLNAARKRLGLTQQQAAKLWDVSQTYVSLMEHGERPVPTRLARRVAERDRNMVTALPVDVKLNAGDLPRLLGSLGYPGFAYLEETRAVANPAAVVLAALSTPVPTRVTEALPWVLATFAHLNWHWLVDAAKVANLQNRLGYLVVLAKALAARRQDVAAVRTLADAESRLEDARLVKEDTLGRAVTEAERRHLRAVRPEEAAHWNVLTTLDVNQLRYVD